MIKLGAPHIYIAHPMGAEDVIAANCELAIEYGDQLYRLGAVVHIPALCREWHRLHPKPYEEWIAYDFGVIERCDALFRVPGRSPGADREVSFAHVRQIPILHTLEMARSFISSWKGRLGELGGAA